MFIVFRLTVKVVHACSGTKNGSRKNVKISTLFFYKDVSDTMVQQVLAIIYTRTQHASPYIASVFVCCLMPFDMLSLLNIGQIGRIT